MDVLQRLVMSQEGNLGALVTPSTCMQSPTVHAIVTAVAKRISVTPVHIYEKVEKDGKKAKKPLPDHSVERLLRRPNSWQTSAEFWMDAASTVMRWGNFYCWIARGTAGPIRELLPLGSNSVKPEQDEDTWEVTYRVSTSSAKKTYPASAIFHARGPARNFYEGDSPVEDVRTAIALEILAEKFGVNFFRNGALPLLIFSFMEGSAGFETKQQEDEFIKELHNKLGGDKMLNSMLLPKGIDKPDSVMPDMERMQLIDGRKYQREVIAGAFGMPQHLVGNLEDAHYANIEQQDKDFTQNVVYPVVKMLEAAIERDLLTDNDRRRGVIARFNLDSIMRATFKERQEGLRIQREMGIISANEWREHEGMNPRDDEFGDDYMHPANMTIDGEEPDEAQFNDPPGSQEPTE
jgi:HK97 family phage portal protein